MKRIFILGAGRSGTSLLQSMLNAHSEIAFFPETQFLRNYVWRKSEWKSPATFIDILKNDDKYARIGQFVKPPFRSSLEYYNLLCQQFLDSKGKTVIGDKDPRNIEFVHQLTKTFDGSCIVHIIRDPRDVILSRTKADWSKHWPFFMHAFIYEIQLLRGIQALQEVSSNQVVEVKYEALLENPRGELKNIMDSINIEFELGMLSFNQSAEELMDDSETQWKKETLKPLNSSNTNKWRKAFSPYQIALIEAICRNSMAYNNYCFAKPKMSWISRCKILAFKSIFLIFKVLYPLRVRFL